MSLSRPSSFRYRIVLWLLAFATALTLAVIAQGSLVIEHVERAAWKSLLTAELDYYMVRTRADPAYRWDGTDGLLVFAGADDPALPEGLRGLPPGLHDEVPFGQVNHAVLVRDVAGTRYTVALDIEAFESQETGYERLTVLASLLLLLVIGVATVFGVGRLLRPLSRLANDIGGMDPGSGAGRVELAPGSGSELVVIADAFNDYVRRNAEFVERERDFINIASHELRTPVAVINGAAELGLQDPHAAQQQLRRIQRSAREMEQLMVLLLALARDPGRLAGTSTPLFLDLVLQQVVEDHRYLTAGKSLELRLAPPPKCEIQAPPAIVRAAVGNLLRNAIEHSDSGCIDIRLQDDATVVIRDPGHGMSPEQISAIYTRMARGEGDPGDSGIGLELISRLCEHFGWRLELQSGPDRGTTATLQFVR